eukprot:TRINITY_DN57739_c0_g1_i1.p1 TRINITY_DN57739_c0_g1~~TRINITY_DN57739_c0_g1_i1.p1  ORF type:complete len:493 (+),score=72.25 TRINITY_DN57739_c0_g1_i1:33-1481(+)
MGGADRPLGSPAPAQRRRRTLGLVLLAALLAGVVLAWPVLRTLQRACYLLVIWAPALLWRSPGTVVFSLQSSGPVFIKLAQWLSTRRDILPGELCDAMGMLHEHVPCSLSQADISRAAQSVPGLELGQLLGGGCVAQVYLGDLLDQHGETKQVAVKVRREHIVPLLHTDLTLLRWTARCLTALRPSLQWMAMERAVDNFGWYMTQQVDLRIEAEHARHFARNFRRRPAVRVPRVVNSTESVLVMELAQGVSLSEFVKQNHSHELRLEVHALLTDMMAKMGLQDNFLHGDLHPGNLFISLEGKHSRPVVTLIDLGISIEMSKNLQDFAKSAMLAAFRMRPLDLGDAMVKLHQREGLVEHCKNLDELTFKVGYLLLAGCFMVDESIWSKTFPTYQDYNGTRVSEYFTLLMRYLSEHRVRVSPDLWSVMTAFALIEGSIAELGFGVNVLGACTPYLFNPWDIPGRIQGALSLKSSGEKSQAARAG